MAFIKPRESVELPTRTEAEGERRELRGEVATVRSPEAESELVANSIGSLLQRVAGSSVQEIDRLIAELQTLRKLLQNEGARVQREITEYAHLSQSAMQTTKVIAENLARRKSDADAPKVAGEAEAMLLGPGGQERCRATTGLRPDGGAASPVQRHEEAEAMGSSGQSKRLATR
jgi:hypothetical protein